MRRTEGRAGKQPDGRTPKQSPPKPTFVKAATRGISKSATRRTRIARPPVRLPALFASLQQLYPGARCALNYRNAYELLCATILSAQCTDTRVNMVTPTLFERYPTPYELARANPAEVEEIIKSTGFFRNKTRSLIGMAQAIVADHDGEVPRTMEELRQLPGVGRKTANVVLSNAFDTNEGVTVDTHVTRLSRRLGLTEESDPILIENDLMRLFPRENWGMLSHLLIFHGRQVCIARRPRCEDCGLARICPSAAL